MLTCIYFIALSILFLCLKVTDRIFFWLFDRTLVWCMGKFHMESQLKCSEKVLLICMCVCVCRFWVWHTLSMHSSYQWSYILFYKIPTHCNRLKLVAIHMKTWCYCWDSLLHRMIVLWWYCIWAPLWKSTTNKKVTLWTRMKTW